MTDTRTAGTRGSGRSEPSAQRRGIFGAISLFISQILDELRKVVRPTRNELWNYTIVVIVFVSVMMALVSGVDFGFSKLVGLVFGSE